MPNPPASGGVLNKKIVGIKGKWWLLGGAGMAGVAYFLYVRGSTDTATTDTTAADPTASTAPDPNIDPSTGLPYDEEAAINAGYSGAYGGAYGSPYGDYGSSGNLDAGYDNELLDQIAQDVSSMTSDGNDPGGTGGIDNNKSWAHHAENLLEQEGMSKPAARAAIAAYLSGLPLSTKQLHQVETAVGRLGNPPQGAPRPHHEPHHKNVRKQPPKKVTRHRKRHHANN